MRVLIHTDEYAPTAQACTNRMRSFADALMSFGAEVVVVCSKANLENGAPKKGPERVIYAPAYRMRKKTAVTRLLNNMTFSISSFFCALSAGKIDFVITTSPPPLVSLSGWLTAKAKKALLVYDVRDIWPEVALEMGSFSETSFFCRLFRAITRFMYAHADVITTVSPGKVRKIHEICAADKDIDAKLVLVGNGFDEKVETYPIDDAVADGYGLREGPVCVYIGNIGLAQGLEALLRLAEKTSHKEVRFLLFGKGAAKESLEAQAREMGLRNVEFCGSLPHEHVNTILHYASASFISLKSSKMRDSIPTKLYEALGIGCPVLLLAEGDACEILDETQLGRHLSPNRPDHLAEVFDGMIDDYAQIVRFRESAREIIHSRYTRRQTGDILAKELWKRYKEKEGKKK